MRPERLSPLFRSVSALPGIGPKSAATLGKLCGEAVIDLLFHLPNGIVDRGLVPAISQARSGRTVTAQVTVLRHRPPDRPGRPYRVRCKDSAGEELDIVFFHARGDYVARQLPQGAERLISGKLEMFHGVPQIPHPDYIELPEKATRIPAMEPVYPLTAGLTNAALVKAMDKALQSLPRVPEWIDTTLKQREAWPDWAAALNAVHRPQAPDTLDRESPARRRLAYDELLSNQLALAVLRDSQRRQGGRPLTGDGNLVSQARAALPYGLTGSQEQAGAEIAADMASDKRMLRLLQGDVGSGKTIVALLAMLQAIEAGTQAAMMAPTEILARQHFETLVEPCRALGIRLELLTGRIKGRERADLLEDLAAGRIAILVGTHAVFSDDIAFRDLGLAVIDEQHRFGVHQRLQLQRKGHAVDTLVMTATPIPRTLALTAYGDLDNSRLTEKPPGRQPIDTRVISNERIEDVTAAVGRKIAAGERAYWICPLVAESETVDLAAAEDRYAALKAIFGEQVGLVHGRLKGPEKEAVMEDFATGRVTILVATTVVEVGVNVPEATVMVIEQAERFGLAQLHQLRGRVGRGTGKSTCLLLYQAPLNETAEARLRVMRETEDGFRIAEEDLRLRGGGEVLGTRQSGLPEFRLADLAEHADLLSTAADDARLLLSKDPALETSRGQALRHLLYLFRRDEPVLYLRSG